MEQNLIIILRKGRGMAGDYFRILDRKREDRRSERRSRWTYGFIDELSSRKEMSTITWKRWK